MQQVKIDKKVIIPDLFILQTDGYKPSHWRMYPKNLTQMVSYLESRGGDFDKIMYFGLQYYILRYLVGQVVTREDIEYADKFLADYFGDSTIFNRAGWEYILEKHNGYLPLIIRAIPEGTVTKKYVVQMTIENTDPHCAWLVNYAETLLMKQWYSCTVGSQSHLLREFINQMLEKTGDPSLAEFKVHCFGYRGIASEEQSYLAGAHLISFRGSDTLGGVRAMQTYYDGGNCANSIAATEHSIMCVHSENKNDLNAFYKILDAFPNGLLACVSDTYDIFRACEWAGTVLKEKILARNGQLIMRPDCYDDKTEILTNNGWKLFKDLKNDDLVSQVLDNGEVEFVKPLKYIEQEYEGKMYQYLSEKGRLDSLVTPNHKVVFTKNKKFVKYDAEYNTPFYNKNMVRSGKKVVGTKNNLTEYERLLIAFQADGSYPSGFEGNMPEKSDLKIRFNFTKERKCKRLVEICVRVDSNIVCIENLQDQTTIISILV